MKKYSHVILIIAGTATLASGSFAVVAAVSSANGRTKPAAARIEPAMSSTTVAPPGTQSEMVAEVSIADFSFGPPDLAVAVGSTVTWTNRDNFAHSVFTADGMFGSPDLESGDTYSVTVDQPGTIDYYCDIHVYMRGTITVTP